ncbi:secretion system protein [Pseudoalteromonas sp. BMB]|uniref:type II secretion system F family protein n=1 Tax=Pseudoalteromonas sp. BMB TaxID=1874619 RepID=UPI00083DD59B|nr:type II secretion system F family protein [Pseudoalteromonas sp. BMB]ODB36780.1 secretion system protein [Pseudoalteromonas sp. BMB]
MKSFDYRAYDQSGAKFEGKISALDKKSAYEALAKDGLVPYEIKVNDSQKKRSFFGESKVSLKDIEFFTSELSLLLATGIRIDKGLNIIARTKAKPALAGVINSLSSEIKSGNSLSQALRKHDKVFDSLYCNLVELGESTGELNTVFKGLARDLKFRRTLQGKIVSSLTYPAVIFFVCILSIFFIFNVIIPKMADMFSQAENLPWYTELMLNLSEFVTRFQIPIIAASVFSVAGLVSLFNSKKYQGLIDRLMLRLPILCNATLTLERIRFNSGLALMVNSGLAIDKALELASNNIKNTILTSEVNIAQKKVKEGESLSKTLSQTSIYPPFYISLLEVGEETGSLGPVFDEISSRSREDFESWTERLTAILEPLMILFMGVFVGGVVVIMLMSMVSLNEVSF